MLSLILSILVGAGLGGVLGYVGQCRSGTCPLTASWPRGAFFGAALGLMFHLGTGRELAGARVLRDTDGPVRPVAKTDFQAQVLDSSTPVVVDFYATWCGPCKRLAPTLAKLAGEYAGRVTFVKVDVDKEPELASRYGVSAVPTLLLFRKGAVADVVTGALGEQLLRQRIEALLAERG